MHLDAIWRVALVAVSLALDVFAVGIGVGMRGADTAAKFRIGAAFATSEVAMTLLGAGIGAAAGRVLGSAAGYLGFGALVAVGLYMIVETVRETESGFDLSRGWGLFVAALSLSLDSLGIGFSILYIGAPLIVSLVAIAFASVTSTTLGLTFGGVLGRRAEETAGLWAGIVLVLTGLGFAAEKYLAG
ncbi:MAG: manganese efflux pump [Candidatus Eremiobacteraeota bacterium]|nr:manganese efflux pump [Candidatus Eremiobacteraeota bacterium]MBV9646460.1 manganese efflux pump [Candidatus Eremiobacteraeota bacterium]